MSLMPKIAVIIVNWNTGALLADCVASLLRLPEQELLDSIRVVDNASTDTSLKQLRQRLDPGSNPLVHIAESKVNLGFARANNQAAAQVNPGAHLLLLNPDTLVRPGSLRALSQALADNETIGVVGPRLRNSDGSLQPSIRRFPTFLVLASFFLKLGRALRFFSFGRKYLALDIDYAKGHIVDQVMGAAFLIRNTVWQAVGPLDENFWVWFEEVDYCRRVTDAGYQVAYTPTGEIVHYGGVSFKQLLGSRRTWPLVRSALRYSHKHLGPLSTVALFALVPLTFVLAVPTLIFHVMLEK